MIKKRNIAIIPARGGSKRIPRKNIKPFLGKPIIAYSIEAALNSGLFDEVMVSTDDEEIAKIAIKYGAKVPFYRSNETANDFTGLAEVIVEVLEQYKSQTEKFDNVCCILATAPFISGSNLVDSYNKLANSQFDAIFPVVKYSFPIQRAMKFDNNKIELIWPDNLTARSQDLEASFHDAGLFYWTKTMIICEQKKLWTNNTTAIEISEQISQDIDTEEDWSIAELKYKIINDL